MHGKRIWGRTNLLQITNKIETVSEAIFKEKDVQDLIARAERWLASNTFENPIWKWETKVWGEIPADFGRK